MGAQKLVLEQAHQADMSAILSLIREAAQWLQAKGTDQWSRPWPDEKGLQRRVRSALCQGTTWICWDKAVPAATITADPIADPYWPAMDRAEPAIYVHRLVVGRRYGGSGLGAALLDWAGRTGRQQHGARWIRLTAWTTNENLHAYYQRQGFVLRALRPDPNYPSGACFQRSTGTIPVVGSSLFRLAGPDKDCTPPEGQPPAPTTA